MSGYTEAGGSILTQAMAGFFAKSRDVFQDNITRPLLVSRARFLNITSCISRSIHDCMTRGVIGSGVRYEPSDTSDFFDDLEYSNLTKDIKRAFVRTGHTHAFDAGGELTFDQMEQMIFNTMIVSGEAWLIRTPDDAWIIKEPDYIKTPYDIVGTDFRTSAVGVYNGRVVVDGIELNRHGKPIAAWYCDNPYGAMPSDVSFERIPFFDRYGNRNIIHVYIKERPEQLRGLPLTSPVIQQLWSTLAYADSELQMAILQCNQSAIITTNTNPTTNPFHGMTLKDLDAPLVQGSKPQDKSEDFSVFPPMGNQYFDGLINKLHFMTPGQTRHLADGEDIKFLTPTAPSTGLTNFIDLQLRMIGASLGIPEQVLSGKFDSNFSAVKGATSAFNHTVKRYRKIFIESFLKPFFEVFCTKYFMQNGCSKDDAQEIASMLAIESQWIPNDSPLTLDPSKEMDYMIKAIEAGLITADEAALQLFGHPAVLQKQENAQNEDVSNI